MSKYYTPWLNYIAKFADAIKAMPHDELDRRLAKVSEQPLDMKLLDLESKICLLIRQEDERD